MKLNIQLLSQSNQLLLFFFDRLILHKVLLDSWTVSITIKRFNWRKQRKTDLMMDEDNTLLWIQWLTDWQECVSPLCWSIHSFVSPAKSINPVTVINLHLWLLVPNTSGYYSTTLGSLRIRTNIKRSVVSEGNSNQFMKHPINRLNRQI